MATLAASNIASDLSAGDLRRRIMGCWLGKAVGGTLGMPFEGAATRLNLSFYEPVPTEMLPNDDLDLQVLWAAMLDELRKRGERPRVDRQDIAGTFLENVDFPWDEYGVAIRNMKLGLKPPFTGSYDNWFTNGMGAAIRSEIWACLAAGDPKLAAAYAVEDACLDHEGPGIHAEQFFAALEAAAFGHDHTDDPRPLIAAALQHIPDGSETKLAVEDTVKWWDDLGDWPAVRRKIIETWGNDNFTDTTQNVAFTILGWLAGGGDFGKTICIAVNCGYDTDCTGATAGALMGILNPDGIGEDWLRPIGRQLVVSPPVRAPGDAFPPTLDALTEQVIALRDWLGGAAPAPADEPMPDVSHLAVPAKIGFVDWATRKGYRDHYGMPPASIPCPEMPADAKTVTFPGTSAGMSRDAFESAVMLMQFTLNLPERREIKLLFNSPQNHRVWLNDKMVLSREGGRMAPSFHRMPLHQATRVTLDAGKHNVTIAMARPDFSDASWVIGAGDPESNQWLPEAFRLCSLQD